jgi:hypothetical protein
MAAEGLSARTERLAALLGRWRTRGRTRETAEAPAIEVDAVDTYEWLPGRAGLLHRVAVDGYHPDQGGRAVRTATPVG